MPGHRTGLKPLPLAKRRHATPKIDKLPPPLEHEIQATFFDYVTAKSQNSWKYANIFAVPNGSYKSHQQAAKYKREGLRSGVPDVFVAVPNFSREVCGAFIEFKREGGKPTDNQLSWHRSLTKAGYLVKIFDNVNDAIHFIDQYIRES